MTKWLLKSIVFALFAVLTWSPALHADTGEIGAGLTGGTLGFGGNVTVGIAPAINARTGFNLFSYDGESTESDVSYDYELSLLSFPVLLDWYPLEGSGFRLTSGILINGNEITATGTSDDTYKIGDTEYPAASVGVLTGKVDFNAVAPYLGIGWGNAVGKDTGLSFALDLGVAFQGSPDISLEASGPLSSNPDFQAELENEIADLEDEIDEFKYYPVITLGLTYKF
jgi:hypothetical protein